MSSDAAATGDAIIDGSQPSPDSNRNSNNDDDNNNSNNNDNDDNNNQSIPREGGIRMMGTGLAAATAAATPDTQQRSATVNLQMDWTKLAGDMNDVPAIRYPTDVIESDSTLDVTDGECVIVGTAGQKITHMGRDLSRILLEACEAQNVASLHKLIFRSHMIHEMQGLEGLPSLQLLELYDNQVQALVLTPNLTTLTVLDMSYNSVRDMSPVQACPNLKELYLARNKLKSIAGLSGLHNLIKLDLGANRIRGIPPEELSGLLSIQELWLGKNKIEVVQGLSTLTRLRRLDIQSNRLLELPASEFVSIAPTLEELFLAHNGLTSVEGGGWLHEGLVFGELNVLDLSRNHFTSANSLGNPTMFPVLEELWISGNQVADWDAVQELKNLSTLETLYLEYNPIQTNDPLYRKSMAQLIPQLKQIDATLISAPSGLGFSGLVRGAAPMPMESDQDRLRRYQDMAIQRAKKEEEQRVAQQQQQQQFQQEHCDDEDSDDSVAG